MFNVDQQVQCMCCVLQVIGQNAQLLAAAQEGKQLFETSLAQKDRQISKLDTAFKTTSQEVLKVWPTSTSSCPGAVFYGAVLGCTGQ